MREQRNFLIEVIELSRDYLEVKGLEARPQIEKEVIEKAIILNSNAYPLKESLHLRNTINQIVAELVFKNKLTHVDLLRLEVFEGFLEMKCPEETFKLRNYIVEAYDIISATFALAIRIQPSIEKIEETQEVLDQSMTKIETIEGKSKKLEDITTNVEKKIENIEVNSISVLGIFSSLIFGLYIISNSSTKILSEFTYDRLGGMIVLFSLSLLLGITLIYFLLYWISLLMNRNISSCECKDQNACTCNFFKKHRTYLIILIVFLGATGVGLWMM